MNYSNKFSPVYRQKKILLTGHTGFKGSWMLAWLHLLGANVKGYALKPENDNDLYKVINGDRLCDSVIADIRDAERLNKEIIDFQPDFIFHFAAQPLVRHSYEWPLYTFEVNVNGTAHLLEGIRSLPTRCNIVIVTTDKVYENRESDHAYRETDKLGGYDPYSASKAAAEVIVSSYRSSFFNPHDFDKHQKAIATARAGNVIGGGDWARDRIVPDIVTALQSGKPVVVRNRAAVRPWQHVLESLGGYLQLGSRLAEDPRKYSTAWNFGPIKNDSLTVEELTRQAIKCWGDGDIAFAELVQQPHEAGLLILDIQKSLDELGWEPRMNSYEAIRRTIEWYKKSVNTDAFELMKNQILEYQGS